MSEAIGFHAAVSLTDARVQVERYGDDARIVSGGTAIALFLRQGLILPGLLVGVAKVPELQSIARLPDGGLRIGAAVALRRLENDPLIAHWPLLAAALRAVATPRIRNMATLGGGLAHADPAQDPPVALAALDARIVVAGSAERRIPAADFALGYYETALRGGEIITAIELPAPVPAAGAAYLKFLPRSVDDYGVVTAAARVELRDGTCTGVRLCLGAVGPTPLLVDVAADLIGTGLDDAALRRACARVGDLVDPIGDVRGSAGYKRDMAVVFARRAVRAAAEHARRARA